MELEFSHQTFEKCKKSNFIKSVLWEPRHSKRTDGQTVAFRNSTNAPINSIHFDGSNSGLFAHNSTTLSTAPRHWCRVTHTSGWHVFHSLLCEREKRFIHWKKKRPLQSSVARIHFSYHMGSWVLTLVGYNQLQDMEVPVINFPNRNTIR
jgi:hypothetical protein